MLEVISEFYNLNLKAETMKGLKQNAQQGYRNGGWPPYGYRWTKQTDAGGRVKSVLVAGPDQEVSTLRQIFDLYGNQGWKISEIVRFLKDNNVPTQRNSTWGPNTIKGILRNQVYVGLIAWNKRDKATRGRLLPTKPEKGLDCG